jgi:ketosteroid isomerase-like protein
MKTGLYIFCFTLLLSCKNKDTVIIDNIVINKDSVLNAIMEIDAKWSETAGQKGYNKSRADFADEKAINLLNGKMPLVGREAIIQFAESNPDTGYTIKWKPLKGDMAESCDLGYTYGSWQLFTKSKTGKDTTLYGNYITVWKRQADGSWKYVIDGGSDTPQEVKE